MLSARRGADRRLTPLIGCLSGASPEGALLSPDHGHAGVAQLVRAPACHAGGRGFKSRHSRHLGKIEDLLGIAALGAVVLAAPAVARTGQLSTSQEPCELHVFPAANELASVQDAASLLGLPFTFIDAAAHGASADRVKQQMTADLPPLRQVEVLTDGRVMSALKLPADTVVVGEPAIPSHAQLQTDPAAKARLAEMNVAIRARRRLTTSTAPCYAELVAANLFVQRDPIDGTRLRVAWYFRNMSADAKLVVYYEGWSAAGVPGYTTTMPEQVEAARTALRKAFLSSLVSWVAANQEKRPQPVGVPTKPPGH
jgi:hypothetical protein